MRAALFLLLTLAACGGAEVRSEPRAQPRPLDESRFLQLALEVLGEYGGSGQQNRAIQAAGLEGNFDADLGVAGRKVAIEYVTDTDRVRLGAALPARTSSGQLRVLAATDPAGSGPMDVLILEDTDYRYDPDPVRSAGAGPTIMEVEGRLQRDIRDFLHHEREVGSI